MRLKLAAYIASEDWRKKYEEDPEGLEFARPDFDWKAWYEQVIK